jgi:hypothetical protein
MVNRADREMARSVRVAFAPIMGILFGIIVVMLLVRSDPYQQFGKFSFPRGIFVIVSEAIMGFGIAISGLRMVWPLHGILLGVVFSLPMCIWIGRVYSYNVVNPRLFFLLLGLNILFGLLIELVLTGILRTRSFYDQTPESTPAPEPPQTPGPA